MGSRFRNSNRNNETRKLVGIKMKTEKKWELINQASMGFFEMNTYFIFFFNFHGKFDLSKIFLNQR